jgi:AcrR family transcriptional regulator
MTSRNTTRQREAGAAARAETRRRLLDAAANEFGERGYVAATVSRIAARAGVTVQTLYLAWGSKRALLRAFMEASLAGQTETAYADELPELINQALAGAHDDAALMIKHIARFYRRSAERAALGWQLYRDAAATDPEVASDWQSLQHARRQTFASLVARLPPRSLRPGLTRAAAADTAWTIASPESYDLLVRTAGYSLDAYERWVSTTLAAALLRPRPTSEPKRRPSPP